LNDFGSLLHDALASVIRLMMWISFQGGGDLEICVASDNAHLMEDRCIADFKYNALERQVSGTCIEIRNSLPDGLLMFRQFCGFARHGRISLQIRYPALSFVFAWNSVLFWTDAQVSSRFAVEAMVPLTLKP
jgi:hypothetical protein